MPGTPPSRVRRAGGTATEETEPLHKLPDCLATGAVPALFLATFRSGKSLR